MSGQYFRAGVGAVIFNHERRVLALERADVPGAWQLPQGGLEESEEPFLAVLREVSEETGISPANLDHLDTYPEPLAYELPAFARSPKTGRGQAQFWFLFRFDGGDDYIDLAAGGEFRAWKWMPFDRLIEATVDFRKPVYRKLTEKFESFLAL